MDAVEEVKARLSIEDVISEYVQLKRAGRNFKGLSPFSNEKTPSFMVSPEKQIWHDFSSGKGGNMFSFIMEVEGLDFKAALELLARKAGVDLDQYRTRGSARGGPNKARLHELLELAAKFYQVHFSKNPAALEYVLKKRKFTKQTALDWRLGYSPSGGTALVKFARSKGFTDQELKLAGLTGGRFKEPRDMFRGRIMIPLQDQHGQVIGFTARLLNDEPNAPKYINTPQTVLYDKSRHIYGLHFAKQAIREAGYSVLVEGNLDVIASHEAGVRQVVATAGTALTEPHLKTLSRFAGEVRLGFDADSAGVAATERAIPIASKVKVSLNIIDIPSGKDPDELIKQDPKLWTKAIEDKKYALDWLIDRHSKLLDLGSAEGKRKFSDVLLPVVRALADDVERDHYLSQIAKTINVSREALDQKLSKTKPETKPTIKRNVKFVPQANEAELAEQKKVQDRLLALTLTRKTLRSFLSLVQPEMLIGDSAKSMLKFLNKNPDFDGKDAAALQAAVKGFADTGEGVQTLEDYVKILSVLYDELYRGLELNELHEEAARLQTRMVEHFVKVQKAKIAAQLNDADSSTMRELLTQAKHYDQLLNQVKG